MILREQQEIIKNIVKEFFDRATITVEIKEERVEEESFKVNIEAESPQLLIGENGQTLSEIQHLLKLILRKKIGSDIHFDLDINNYKKKKTSYLEELAKSIADEVILTGKEKELSPMPAQDRRVIHLIISQKPNVISESRGQEPNRYVAIKPGLVNQPETTMTEE